MQYCNHCKVHIRENKTKCPLCRNILSEEDASEEDVYPYIPPFIEKHTAIKFMIFISIASIVISFAINIIFPTRVNWPLFVVFGLLSLWLGLIVIVKKRYHIPKKIVWQVIIISGLSVFWDWEIGWIGWSLNYVIPTTIVSAMILMYITAKLLRLSVADYITYTFIASVLGIIPILFIVFNWVTIVYPSIISIAFSIIYLAAIFIFQGEYIKTELNKRMHI